MVFTIVAVAAASPSSASGRAAIWWEPRATEFWTVNRAAIADLFANGQCTEWAARRRPVLVRRIIERRISYEVHHGLPEMLPDLDARYWATDAAAAGVPTGAVPARGALVVFQPGVLGARRDGHIAYVERVSRDGSFVISQMNAPTPYRVTYQTLPFWAAWLSGVRFIYHGREGRAAATGS